MSQGILTSRVALVTGGGSPLMGALCRELASLGAAVAVHHHQSADAANTLADRLRGDGARAVALRADLTVPLEIERLAAEVTLALGPASILVHGAASFERVSSIEASPEAWDLAFALDVKAPALLTRALRSGLIAHRGQVILLGDLAAEQGWPPFGPRSAAGAAARSLARNLAVDLAPHARVNTLCLGLVEDEDPGPLERVPLGRPARLDEIRHALRYLVEAEYVTGEVLRLDGGRLARAV